MPTPVETPNRATLTHPERSSTRVTHKAPLAWLPWLAGLLLALLLLLVTVVLAAADDGDDTSGPDTATSRSALADKALVGGAGVAPTAQRNAPGGRQAGTAGTVLFAENSATVDAQGRRVVANAASALKAAGVTSVLVLGYTDVIAGTPVNVPLSKQRAEAVADLLRKALPGVSVTAVGRGEKDPVAGNSSDAGRQHNRRAVIVASG